MVQLYVAEELVPLVAALAAVRASDGGLEAAERSVSCAHSPIRISLRPQGVDFAQQNRRPARWAISSNQPCILFLFFGSS